MTKKTLIAALIAAATLAPAAHAHGGRGWDDDRHWQHERHHRHEWRHHHHDHWRHRAPPPPVWGYAPAWRPAPPVAYDYRPVISVPVPLPPTPWEVQRAVRDSLFGRW